ncbi:cation-dependent mannose-6-phosphate receptor-like [Ptychodera flava]|uniref:cation-dependent mannose-6-phosphate receptor-like n=1 Tax=Ptychodera flava TaxID=63121 RepID=UPI00396A8D3D
MIDRSISQLVLAVVITLLPSSVISDKCEALVGAQNYCACDYKDSSGTSLGQVDLRAIVPKNPPLINMVQGEDSSHKYSYNPCTPFSQGSSSGSCTNKAACQFVSDGSEYTLGTQESVDYSVDTSNNVKFTYSDTQDTVKRTAEVTLKCDKNARNPKIKVAGEEVATYYKYEITTQCACPGVCEGGVAPSPPQSGGLSAGSILCIIFFVLLATYFIGGALVNKYARQKDGTEIIPNASFWSDLPYLIKDGFLFAISPCKKQDAYQQI